MSMRVHNRTRNTVVAENTGAADSSGTRRTGLLKRTGLDPGEGLWIVPCEAVHCFFMKFTIDVIFLNKKKQVVKAVPSLKPWRIAGCMRAHSVLEVAEGTIAATQTAQGDQFEFEKVD
jgi:uncharacterized membrane protein (UPF0127 family)